MLKGQSQLVSLKLGFKDKKTVLIRCSMIVRSQVSGNIFLKNTSFFKICNDCKEAICVSKVLNLLVTGGNKKAKYIYQLSAAGFTKYR